MPFKAFLNSYKPDSFAAAPRLHVSAQAWSELSEIQNHPWFAPYVERCAARATEALDVSQAMGAFQEQGHNWHLMRARHVQDLVVSLITQFRMTGEARCKNAVMQYVQLMHDWEYWSWITWRTGNNDPSAIFDLSYGENSATLAMVNDWLWQNLTDAEKALILATAQRPVRAFLRYFTPQADGTAPSRPWWFENHQSNWNTVCAGGVGMLALSLFEQLPQAQGIVQLVENSIKPYMVNLIALDGAWPEGIGYWNYGMRYAFMYLLSHENTTGRPHWAMEEQATRKSLHFPLDFCPRGVPCSFGDVNRWAPLPFHHAVARRMHADDLASELFALHAKLSPAGNSPDAWPNAAEALLLIRPVEAPDTVHESEGHQPFVKLYQGQDWGLIADRQHNPSLFMTVRGGTTQVPHGHMDLTSFHAGVEDEHMIINQGVNEYLDTTFSPRRGELYDITPGSKNVVLIGGVGIAATSKVVTRTLDLAPGIAGLHIDATDAMGVMRDGPAVLFNRRAYLMIDQQALLVIDHLLLPHENRCESRLHTPMSPVFEKAGARLTGKRQRGNIHFACNVPATLYQGISLSTTPREPVCVMRWIADSLHEHVAFATLMLPGDTQGSVSLTANEQGVDVTLNLPQGQRTLHLSADLLSLRQ